jgi:tellurite resistance protein
MTFLRSSTEHLPPIPEPTDPIAIEQARQSILHTTESARCGEKLSRATRQRLATLAIATLSNPNLPAFEAVFTAGQVLAELPDRDQTDELHASLTRLIQERALEAFAKDAPRELAATRLAILETNRDRPFPAALEYAHQQLGQPSTEEVIRKSERFVTDYWLGETGALPTSQDDEKPS